MTMTDRLAGINEGVAVKAPCKVATTANLDLLGLVTVDGVALAEGDRVLVKNQTNGVENGIYKASASAWDRAPDFDGTRDVVEGSMVFVIGGSTNASTFFRLATSSPVIGSTALSFTQVFDAASWNFTQSGTGATTRSAQSKMRDVFSLADFGAVGNGTTDDAAAINNAILAAYNAGGGEVTGIRTATYRVSTAVLMRPGVRLNLNGATITQAAAANLLTLVDFNTHVADGAVLENGTVDGARSTNTDNGSVVLVRVGTASDTIVRRCTITNSCGYCIVANYGFRNTIIENKLSNSFVNTLAVFGMIGATSVASDAFHRIEDNTISGASRGPILVQQANYCSVRRNKLTMPFWGVPGSRIKVDISGSTLTWVSGPTFASVKPGQWVITNSGAEYLVTAVTNSTTLTVHTPPPSGTNVSVDIGSGDGIGLIGCSYCQVESNTVYGCVSYGAGCSIGGGDASASYNTFVGNTFVYCGKSAINLTWDTGAGLLIGNELVANKIVTCASGSGGSSTLDRIAITITGQSSGKIYQTLLDGNSVHGVSGDGETLYWLGTDGQCADGSIIVGQNTGDDCTNASKVYQDIRSIVLDSKWGSTATAALADAYSTGDSVRLKITSSGTGQNSGAVVTVNRATDVSYTPIPICKIISSVASADTRYGFQGEELSTRGSWQATFMTTPVASDQYVLVMK